MQHAAIDDGEGGEGMVKGGRGKLECLGWKLSHAHMLLHHFNY